MSVPTTPSSDPEESASVTQSTAAGPSLEEAAPTDTSIIGSVETTCSILDGLLRDMPTQPTDKVDLPIAANEPEIKTPSVPTSSEPEAPPGPAEYRPRAPIKKPVTGGKPKPKPK
ncbi:hypothetical protein NEOLEDRAFT_1178163 [Neolentinus lepideus HHB14362 ss-1]|uniref:Uncharacterized protein n=1 Tax=Neolentinus lepideus HHB14362 ss-1 TaxID=1314782 RepID=A0A165SUI5_9AGAM|nr:hypothetical protein NEOLEDRAFT_1178163 [Neolentinus lepideus HHB14362 ss-1]